MGKPTSEQDGAFVIEPATSEVHLDMVSDSDGDTLFDLVDLSAPIPAQARDIEPQISEPHIEIDNTKVSTRGGNLASTALNNIMKTFNAASRKVGVDTIRNTVSDSRFETHFNNHSPSIPHIVADFMDGKAVGATLKDDDAFPGQEPPHKQDIEILNGSDIKRAAGRPDELIASEEAELKKWLVANYGAGAEQTINYPYGTDTLKVTYKDREALVKKVSALEQDAKRIASGDMLPYGSIDIDEVPLTDEERDIADQYERESEDR